MRCATVCFAFLLAALLTAPAAAVPDFPKISEGVVQAVSQVQIVIKYGDAIEEFQVEPGTKITLDANPAPIDSIVPGHIAKIAGKEINGKRIAISIDAVTPPATP